MADPTAGIGVPAALFAGAVSFRSPCVLPLVPGYLSVVTGESVDELDRAPVRRVLLPSLLGHATGRERRPRGGRRGLRDRVNAVRGAHARRDPDRCRPVGVRRPRGSLLAVYSAGLAIPFALTAGAFSKMTSAFRVVKRHYRAIIAAGGAILIFMGVLSWTGEVTQLKIEAQRFLDRFGLNFAGDT